MDHALTVDGVPSDAGSSREARFEQLFAEYYGDIVAHLCRLVGDQKQAEDLAQDAIVKAYGAPDRLPVEANTRTWLYRIATDTALDWLRRRRPISWLPLFDRDSHRAARPARQWPASMN